MPHDLGQRLKATIDRELPRLQEITEELAGEPRPEGDGWTRKQELGHLLDSAVNNHLRFVRATLESGFQGPSYDQNGWVRLHDYNGLPWTALVELWTGHNAMLAHLVEQIPDSQLQSGCVVGSSGKSVTLEFLIEDYRLHLQHHVDHILRRDQITQYPGAAIGV